MRPWPTPTCSRRSFSVSARAFDNKLRVLEWGSGLSTLHYPDWLRRRGVRVDWTALEHDRALFRMRSRLLYARVARRSSGPRTVVDRSEPLDDYVGMPAALGRRFHAIIVDGRKRRRCLAEAATLLEDGGSCFCTTPNESTTALDAHCLDRVDGSETGCGSARRSRPT